MNLTINVLELTYTSPGGTSALTVDAGGIKIGSFTLPAPSNTYVATLTNNTSVDITVTKTGYHPYSMTIDNVYGDDKTIEVVLAQVLPTNAAPYNQVFAHKFSFVDSCSFKADYYTACSLPGSSSWYIDNVLYTTGTKAKFNFYSPGGYQVKHVAENEYFIQVSGSNFQEGLKTSTTLGNLLVLDTTINLNIAEYRPDLSLDVTSTVSPTTSTDLTCYTKGEGVTFTPTWTLNRPGANAANHTIVYTVTDPDGVEVMPFAFDGLSQNTFPLNTTFANASITFPLNVLGTYKVEAKIIDTHCGTEFPVTYCVETCNFINVKYKSCNTYTIENKSSVTPFDYSIEQHGVPGKIIASGTAAVSSSTDITFSNPGIFVMTVTYLKNFYYTTTETYIISNHCEVENCITSYITDLLCGGGDPCAPCPEDNELNQILLMSYTYFMKLNKEYALNNFYTGLSQEKLDELTSISGVLNKMSLFCNRRACLDSSFSEGTNTNGPVNNWSSKSGDCGCNSTNTASTNVNTSSSGCGCS